MARKWTPEKAILKSTAFWAILTISMVFLVFGGVSFVVYPQTGSVLIAFATCGLLLAAVIAGMVAIWTGRPRDERLRESR